MGLMPSGFDEAGTREPVLAAAEAQSIAAPGCPEDDRIWGINGAAKRALDIIIAGSALIVLAPLLLVIAALVISDGGPALFVQSRIGRGGRVFAMYKFRTMHTDAEAILKRLVASCPVASAEWNTYQKLKRDPRVTRVGRFLRASSIDELPQLCNVLMGQMSIVGQRPILPAQREAFGPHIHGYERARPGITGLWQVRGRNRLSFSQRAQLGSEYVNRWSLWFDIKIIALTIPAVLFGSNAF